MIKPQPVVVKILCSLCDLDWPAHGDKPTTEDCIRLLKQELSRRPRPYQQFFQHQPYPYTITYGQSGGLQITNEADLKTHNNAIMQPLNSNAAVEYRTPEVS